MARRSAAWSLPPPAGLLPPLLTTLRPPHPTPCAQRVGKWFKIKERNSCLTQELRGGTVTFLTVAYILAVNANIITDTGGPCITEGRCEMGAPGLWGRLAGLGGPDGVAWDRKARGTSALGRAGHACGPDLHAGPLVSPHLCRREGCPIPYPAWPPPWPPPSPCRLPTRLPER